jgi:hypothetical protein
MLRPPSAWLNDKTPKTMQRLRLLGTFSSFIALVLILFMVGASWPLPKEHLCWFFNRVRRRDLTRTRIRKNKGVWQGQGHERLNSLPFFFHLALQL